MINYSIRRAIPADLHAIISLFRATVHTINSKDYDADQVRAWAQAADDESRWLNKISDQYFVCCENNKEILGFGSIDPAGYLDLLYVHARYQGLGIATLILEELEQFAEKNNISLILSDVSITARPFFEKKGYQVVEEKKKNISGVGLTNFRMQKII